MVICKYFLRGSCNYGNNCWNEHTQGQGRQQYNDDWSGRGGGGGGGGAYNDWSGRGGGGGGGGHTARNNKNKYVWTNPGISAENKFSPLANQSANNSAQHSQTPGTANSGKDLKTQEILDLLETEMKQWEDSHMWPFSCFAYAKELHCFPGFDDHSMEEVRWRAYDAQKTGNFASYTQWVAQAATEYKTQRDRLKKPTGVVRKELIGIVTAINQHGISTQTSTSGLGTLDNTSASGASSVFGKGQTAGSSKAASVFGSSSVFGQSGSGFAGSQSAQAASVFGGNAAAPTSNLFGSSSVFGASAAASSQPGKSVFGNPSVTTTAQPAASVFGNSAMATNPQAASSVFGNPSAPANPQAASSVFGNPSAPANPQAASSVFGNPSAPANPQAASSVFGNPSASGNAQAASSVFGNPSATANAQAASSVFGKPSSTHNAAPAFSQPASVFGQQAPSKGSVFGNQQSTSSSVFGNQQSSSSVFGGNLSNSVFNKTNQTLGQGFTSVAPNQSSATGDSSVYTALDQITPEEKEQFEAPKFTLWNIPVRPPPQELCV